MSKTLAELVQGEMARLGWSLGEVAARGSTSKQNVQNVARGITKNPRPPMIEALARAFASAPDSAYTYEEWTKRIATAAGLSSLEAFRAPIAASSDPDRMADILARLPMTPELRALLDSLAERHVDPVEAVAKLLRYLEAQKSTGTETSAAHRRANLTHRR